MKKHIFIKTLCTLLAVMLVNAAFAQEVRSYEFGHDRDGVNITNQTRGDVTISYSMSKIDFASFDYNGETMQSIGINGITLPNEKGLPNVPNISRFIAIPQGAEAVLRVKSYEQTLIKDVNIEPSLGIQAETEEPNTEYVKDAKVYSEDKFYPEEFASLSNQTSLRGVDVVAVEFSPVRYNPVTKEAIIYHDIEVEIAFEGGNGQFGDDRLRSPYWDPILEQNIMNYNSLPVIDYEKRMQGWLNTRSTGYEYVIVTPNNDDWAEAANSLKEYRLSQGIITTVMRLDEMGVSSTTEMKTWFHNAYSNWDIAPVAFLLFGDHNTNMTQGIPAETVSHPYEGSCISDNQYADVTGDYLPEMVFSRLVAANGTEAAMMASKQIEYEYTNPNMDASAYQSPVTALGWQTERWFQLCSEVVGGYFRSKGKTPQRINCIYEGTPGSSWSSATNTATIVNYFGPSGRSYIPSTPSELGGWTGGTPAQIVDAINAGTMLVQHRDHGLETGWGEPAFRSNHVNQLTNVGKMPFVMSINCLTGKFNNSTDCFAETFMRHTYNGENAGAVGILCPTEVSYSFVNDVFVWGVYDQFQPDFMPDYGPYASTEGNWNPAFGNVAGKYFLAQSSWPSSSSSVKQITYQMFTAHCDAFLRLYSEVPQTIEVTHPEVVFAGTTSVQVTAPEGTTIAISKETDEGTVLLGVATATGELQDVTIPAQTPSTTLNIVVTGQNYLRYVDEIEVITQDGPYVVFNSYNLNNTSGQLNYGETINMTVNVKNVGNETANNVNVTLTSTSDYINITGGTATLESIAANATQDINYLTFTVADDIPDGTNVGFTLTCTSDDDTWTSSFSIVAHAPKMQFNSITVQEGNIMPGQTGHIAIIMKNDGTATSPAGTLTITTDPNLVFASTTFDVPTIAADATYQVTAEFTASEAIPYGTAYTIYFQLAAGEYTLNASMPILIGIYTEDFETGDFSKYDWEFNTYPWAITTTKVHGGSYSAKSTNTGNSTYGTMSVTLDVTAEGNISFYYSVSSESNFDKLYFYIDGVSKGYWSGTIDWTLFSTAVTTGTHTFQWRYYKDGSVSSGSDCVWIDDIEFPPVYIEIPLQPVYNLEASVTGYQVSLTWDGPSDATQYIVTRDGEQIATVEEKSFIEEFQEAGTHTYSIVATDGTRLSEPTTVEVTLEPFTMQWTADPYQYADNMTVTSVIHLDGVEQYVNTLEVGAFCGTECRGSQVAQYFPPTGRYILSLIIYGESGDEITFRIYDHVHDVELDMMCNNQLTFEPNAIHGGLTSPYIIDFWTAVHCVTLATGNTWYSTYINIDGAEGLALIESGVGSAATVIKSQTAYTMRYEDYGWFGTLSEANNEQMYIITTTEEKELCMRGSKSGPSAHPIALHQNWNWIGYPVDSEIAVNTALGGITATSNDIIKSQSGYSIYYEGSGWFGSLNTMAPGSGYMLFQAADLTQNLVYPSAGDDKAMKANVTAQDNHYVPNINEFATNMSVTAVISINDEIQRNENLEVAAFCNGKVRGSARPMYFEPLDEYVVLLTIYGNDGDEITFKLYDVENGFTYETNAKETLTYADNDVIGTLAEPYVFSFNIANATNEINIDNIALYPNPANRGEEIMLGDTFDRVEIFNTIGIKIADYQNVNRITSLDTAGSYIIKITEGGNTHYGKIVVK